LVSAKAHNVENNLIDFVVAFVEFKSVELYEKQPGIFRKFLSICSRTWKPDRRPFGYLL